MFYIKAEKKLKRKMLEEVELQLINNMRDARNTEEIMTELEALKELKNIKDETFKVDGDVIVKSAVTLACVLMTLHYEKTGIITTKVWSKVKF